MVFSNLGPNEKNAFFSLLDEYFAARPEIFGNAGDAEQAQSNSPVAPTPSAIAAAQRALGANLRAVAPSPSNVVPPTLPRRSASQSSATSPPAPGSVAASVASLQSNRKLGDVETTSVKNMVSSIRSSGKSTPATPIVPPAFGARKNTWGAPPARGAAASPPAEPEPEEEEQEEEQEEAQGEWAEALYDYDSADAGDLQIRAHQNVWVTERTSDDWWTGEFEGKTGLFPASYVKIL